jgi:hypothetical protein
VVKELRLKLRPVWARQATSTLHVKNAVAVVAQQRVVRVSISLALLSIPSDFPRPAIAHWQLTKFGPRWVAVLIMSTASSKMWC